jgi:hypothetical protein
MKSIALLFAVASPLLLSGCIVSVGGDRDDGQFNSQWEEREYNNRTHIGQLELGTSYENVVRKMGVADFNELNKKDKGVYRILFYRTQRTMEDGLTSKDECTPLVFLDNKLIGWGESAYLQL